MNQDMLIAIAPIVSAMAAIFAVFVGIISLIFTHKSIKKQEEHNRNGVRPICEIRCTDYENKISVFIYNAGIGPLVIKELKCENIEFSESTSKLISLMPPINQTWSTFTGNVKGRAILSGDKIVLMELNPINNDIKNQIRKTLSQITISIKFTDIYGIVFEKRKRLKYFGRHFLEKTNPNVK